MSNRTLDIDAVQAFVHVAELGSFTHTAKAMRTTQSGVSLKLKRLEERLGYKLLERTPRRVSLTEKGSIFLDKAKDLLVAHEDALQISNNTKIKLAIGISDHVAGPELPSLISRINTHDPKLLIEIRIASSADLLRSFDQRELDTVLVRFNKDRTDSEVIAYEKYSWFAAPNWKMKAGDPLPLATMPEPCGVRHMAGLLLDEDGIKWTETFVGGGIPAVSAAVIAGLGISALPARMLPMGAKDVGQELGLPELPRLPITLHTRVVDQRSRQAIDVLSAAFKAVVRD
ncbi:LysR family transcriptional regulator [Sneathiella sp. P13V-1]|uniref:LysR family transcriptional regulator n=1 Tax=Sneathiella sp. P13V-1 TaxID=2697366 RepID=UPI00187B1488|nr:LysR family transcriptional regulator [Sneathiella sp. P13V-1]MBE7637392.1 LysR family transcriptional regulator [Sneathiella sp. P13V-1]